MVDLGQSMRQSEFGRLVGLSQQAVSQMIQRGTLDPDGTAGEWLLAYCARLREEAAGRGLISQEALNQAKIREANATADLKRFDYLQKSGAVITVADIEPALAAWARAARSEFQYALEKLAAGIESQHGIEVDTILIDECAAPAYNAIRNYPRQSSGAADPGRGGMGAATADPDPGVAQ